MKYLVMHFDEEHVQVHDLLTHALSHVLRSGILWSSNSSFILPAVQFMVRAYQGFLLEPLGLLVFLVVVIILFSECTR